MNIFGHMSTLLLNLTPKIIWTVTIYWQLYIQTASDCDALYCSYTFDKIYYFVLSQSIFCSTADDKTNYDTSLRLSSLHLSPLQMNLLKFALSLRAYSAKVQMFNQVKIASVSYVSLILCSLRWLRLIMFVWYICRMILLDCLWRET